MSRYLTASAAARYLGVQPATLYAYVSRGIVERVVGDDGRSSLYPLASLDAALETRRTRQVGVQPAIDVEIVTAITQLDSEVLRYRGHDVAALSTVSSFEAVAELLWGGTLVPTRPSWPNDPALSSVARSMPASLPAVSRFARIVWAAVDDSADGPTDVAPFGRRVLPVLAGPGSGTIAERVAKGFVKRPTGAAVAFVERALILLADHELASSTLAARIAASTHASPAACVAAGYATLIGPLHGGASRQVFDVLTHAEVVGAEASLAALKYVPGFGHKVYKSGDPRLAPLMDAVREHRGSRLDLVESVLDLARRRLVVHPNVDFALGSAAFVTGWPRGHGRTALRHRQSCGLARPRRRGVFRVTGSVPGAGPLPVAIIVGLRSLDRSAKSPRP